MYISKDIFLSFFSIFLILLNCIFPCFLENRFSATFLLSLSLFYSLFLIYILFLSLNVSPFSLSLSFSLLLSFSLSLCSFKRTLCTFGLILKRIGRQTVFCNIWIDLDNSR
uniref:Uncharacterized protein n=1 Tax=Cacopsylla melanoneura TaxID=428564 RepID=A0A8D8VMS6_9HEMI